MHAVVEIVPDWRGEFRLVARLFEDLGVDFGDAPEGPVINRARYAAFDRCGAETGDPAFESRIRQRRRQEKAEAEACRGDRACNPSCVSVNKHLFPLIDFRKNHSSPKPVMNQFTMSVVRNENAVALL